MHQNPFSGEAPQYAHLRPTYPTELFDYLSVTVPSTRCAWDCATGNGQSAIHLVDYFDHVIATDESKEMIAQAPQHRRITYRVAKAKDSGLEDLSVDLVAVATAIHWFDLDRFYEEVKRVVRLGGVIAAWTYFVPVFDNAIDDIIRRLVHDILGEYWDKRVHYAAEGLSTLPFPFEPMKEPVPSFESKMQWNMEDLLGYFETWSASEEYLKERGIHSTELIKNDLVAEWGPDNQTRELHFPLHLRIGHV
jgi:ubiquinone/menaquinone biosynthesis C-methylase UbiE